MQCFESETSTQEEDSAASSAVQPVRFPIRASLNRKKPPRKKRRSTRPLSAQRSQRAVEPVDEWEQDGYGYDEYEDYDEYVPAPRRRTTTNSKRKKKSKQHFGSGFALPEFGMTHPAVWLGGPFIVSIVAMGLSVLIASFQTGPGVFPALLPVAFTMGS